MKTLDEVIEGLERQEAFVMYYTQDKTQFRSDVLHYLKEYRDYQDTMCALPDYYEWVHSADNPPLTWDELKQMEGKPVWVEGRTMEDEYKFWCIVGKTDVLDRYIHLRGHGHNNWKDTYGDWWQAYRKERE